MRSANAPVLLLVGYHLTLLLLAPDGGWALGSRTGYVLLCGLLPCVALVARHRPVRAVAVLVSLLTTVATMLLIQRAPFTPAGVQSLGARPLPIYLVVGLLLPGMFMASELVADDLPHELSQWTGLTLFRPMVAVIASRDRIARRFAAIRETAALRGIDLGTAWGRLRWVFVWVIPLATATVMEAGYADRFRDMLGSRHRFVPTRPRQFSLSRGQRVAAGCLVLAAAAAALRITAILRVRVR